MYRTLTTRKLNRFDKRKRNKVLFYCLLMLVPVTQICIFYFYINFNSIIMAFQEYGYVGGGYRIGLTGWGFNNFKVAWDNFVTGSYRLRNSILFFLCNLFIDIPLALFSSYYLYKKKFASGFFKVMLFMPQILSAMILAIIYRAFCSDVYKEIVYMSNGTYPVALLDNPNTQFIAVVLFNLIMSFGVNVLIYTSAMSGVNQSLIESSELDGCNSFGTFVYVILPMIFPTISTLLVIAISSLFVNQFQVYSLIGEAGDANVANVGFYLYVQSLNSSLIGNGNFLSYPVLSAYGLILTAFVLPTSLLIRYLLNKFGPSAQ